MRTTAGKWSVAGMHRPFAERYSSLVKENVKSGALLSF